MAQGDWDYDYGGQWYINRRTGARVSFEQIRRLGIDDHIYEYAQGVSDEMWAKAASQLLDWAAEKQSEEVKT